MTLHNVSMKTTSSMKTTTALVILDGWGYRENTQSNAIACAKTPVWDALWQHQPKTLVQTSGQAVGLPQGQMGNSEVGHMNMGAGRVIYQNFTRITRAIEDGSFYENPVLLRAVDDAVAHQGCVHILGLLSSGGVHAHVAHIVAMVECASQRGADEIVVHAFTDGRDTPPCSAQTAIDVLEARLQTLGVGRIASVVGRYYAMDRDNNWERIEKAYALITAGKADFQAKSAGEALAAAYQRGETDEFVQATAIVTEQGETSRVETNDAVIFMNFRADRARQLSRAFVEADFREFALSPAALSAGFVTLTQYGDALSVPVAFSSVPPKQVLAEHLSDLGKTQLHLAETEKYAHVTFFFNGGREAPFAGEARILVDSPKVDTYDLQPEMSAVEVTDYLVESIESGTYDFIVCNFANGDMVGHTGVFSAAVAAVECLDRCLGRIVAALEHTGSQAFISADHGNCELMQDQQTDQPHTSHTCGPVPLVYVGPQSIQLAEGGALSDIAPSLLSLMQLPIPEAMTGRSLVVR